MFPEKSVKSRQAREVYAAYWCQLIVVGLLVILVLVGTVDALLFGDTPFFWSESDVLMPAQPHLLVAQLVLAGWLAAAAFGLRRGNLVAYRLSLAGLVLLLLLAAAESGPRFAGGTDMSFAFIAAGSEREVVAQATWMMLSRVTSVAAGLGSMAFSVGAVVLLVIGGRTVRS